MENGQKSTSVGTTSATPILHSKSLLFCEGGFACAKRGMKFLLLTLLTIFCYPVIAQTTISFNPVPGSFPVVSNGKAASIYTDPADAEVVRIAANALKEDIQLVSGISTEPKSGTNSIRILIGTIGKSKAIDALIAAKKISSANKGKWETFSISVVNNPAANIKQALVIAGSDPRGTAYGVFELSRMMGVSPFYWWADLHPVQRKEIYIKGNQVSASPSVKYRGIFLNDEDWGLQPWAAKTFEPETGDIGPKTYSKIFELLLRLKANLIWPAMHPSTKAFYSYPGNKKVAADYAIVVGSSHAEPMLRNNVGEWNEKTMGDFNYITNKDKIYNYWETRVKESKDNDAVYTMGMRGVHDSGMEGVKSVQEAVPLLERIIADQRDMLSKYVNPDVRKIPQVFTVYKEVLEIYDSNLKVPEDITIVWPDDNYGYIQRLNNDKENKRSGGSGVYYHASYWGRPHDYLWLSSTHPGLIREEMMKAYETNSNRLWVLNVGDIKPLEYNIQLFLDMAYNAKPFKESSYTKTHLKNWVTAAFGSDKADRISSVLWNYYQLAFERRPEFMGWSQTEPTTQTKYTEYNPFFYGDESQRRLDSYSKLVEEVKNLRTQISEKDADAFYELVYYPVLGASLMNKKFLYRDKAYLYSKQNRASAVDYAAMSQQAYDDIVKETAYFNTQLANGKWKNILSMTPRDLPVYQKPELPAVTVDKTDVWGIAPEGFVSKDSSLTSGKGSALALSAFNRISNKSYFIDVFLNDDQTVNWTAKADDWLILSQHSGTLNPQSGRRETRVWVSIDWNKISRNGRQNGTINFSAGGKTLTVNVGANNLIPAALTGYTGFVEDNGLISINAANFSRNIARGSSGWSLINGLGRSDKALEALPLTGATAVSTQDPEVLKLTASYAEYDFYCFTSGAATLNIYTLPTQPVNNNYSMRYAVAVDNGPVKMVDFKTVGRSEEWKQNVLRNTAVRKVITPEISSGKHTLRIYMVDPGVILDRIAIDLGGLKKGYSVIPESKFTNGTK